MIFYNDYVKGETKMNKNFIIIFFCLCLLSGCEVAKTDVEVEETSVFDYNRITDNEEEMNRLLFLNEFQGTGYVCVDPKRVPTFSENILDDKYYIYEMETLNLGDYYYCLYVNKDYEGPWYKELFDEIFNLDNNLFGNYTIDTDIIEYINDSVVPITYDNQAIQDFEWIKVSIDEEIPRKIGEYYAIAIYGTRNIVIKSEIKEESQINKEMVFFDKKKFKATISSVLTEIPTTSRLDQDRLLVLRTTPVEIISENVFNNFYLGLYSFWPTTYKVFEMDSQKVVAILPEYSGDLGVYKNLFDQYYFKEHQYEGASTKWDLYLYDGFLEISKNIFDQMKLETFNNSLWIDETNKIWFHMDIDKLTNSGSVAKIS